MHWAIEKTRRILLCYYLKRRPCLILNNFFFCFLLHQLQSCQVWGYSICDLSFFLHVIDYFSFFYDIGPGAPAVFNCVSFPIKTEILYLSLCCDFKQKIIFSSLCGCLKWEMMLPPGVKWGKMCFGGAHFSLDCWIKTISWLPVAQATH